MSAELAQPGLVPDDLVGAVHVLARAVRTAPDAGTALVLVAQAVHSVVPSADLASLTLLDGTGGSAVPRTIWCSNVRAGRLDGLQYRDRQGPAPDVVRGPAGGAVLVADIRLDDRWPMFGPAAARLGIGSALAVSLTGTRSTQDPPNVLSAVNLYSCKAGAFTMADQVIALPLAMQAVMACTATAAHQTIEQLTAAMATRTVIGQAQGILMARYGLDADQAFHRLKVLSQNQNVKLREIARRLTCAGSPTREIDSQGAGRPDTGDGAATDQPGQQSWRSTRAGADCRHRQLIPASPPPSSSVVRGWPASHRDCDDLGRDGSQADDG